MQNLHVILLFAEERNQTRSRDARKMEHNESTTIMQIFQMIKSLLSNKHHQAWTSDRIFTSIYLHKKPKHKKNEQHQKLYFLATE